MSNSINRASDQQIPQELLNRLQQMDQNNVSESERADLQAIASRHNYPLNANQSLNDLFELASSNNSQANTGPQAVGAQIIGPQASSGEVQAHHNDVTVFSASSLYQFAFTGFSTSMVEQWEQGESIDSWLNRVGRDANTREGRVSGYGTSLHHPSFFTSTQDHGPVGDRHCLLFVNHDYDVDGDLNDLGDLPPFDTQKNIVEQAYMQHGYDPQLITDQSDNQIQAQIRHAIEQAAPGDELVIHYMGHGSQAGMVGVDEYSMDDFIPTAGEVINSELQELFQEARAKGVKIVYFAESCYSGFSTDYIRMNQVDGLKNSLEAVGQQPNLSAAERSSLQAAQQEYNAIAPLMQQLDRLQAEPVEITVDGETYRVPFKDMQQWFLYTGSSLVRDVNSDYEDMGYDISFLSMKIASLRVDRTSARLRLSQLKIEKILHPGQSEHIDREIAIVEEEIRRIDQEIPAKQQRLQELTQRQDNIENSEGFEQFGAAYVIFNPIEQHYDSIKNTEQTIDEHLAQAFEHLQTIDDFDPSSANIDWQRWDWNAKAGVGLDIGLFAGADLSYKLCELNRFQNYRLNLGGAIGTHGVQLTESFIADINPNWAVEAGLKQSLQYDGDFQNYLTIGTQYQLNPSLSIFGNLDVPTLGNTFDSNPSPGATVGIKYNF